MFTAAASSPRRLSAIDAARGVALIGMIIVNVGPVTADTVLQRVWLAPYGRASVLFVVVAGISISLLLRPGTARRRWLVVGWRSAILIPAGLFLALLPHGVNVILTLYGVLFLVALVVHRLPSWVLLAIVGVFAVIGPLLFVGESLDHLGEPRPVLEWSGDPLALLHILFVSRPYPLVVWIVPFLVGMLIGRINLRSRKVQWAMIIAGGIAAVGGVGLSELFSALWGTPDVGYGLLLTGAPHGQMPLWLISSIGSAALVLGLLLRFSDGSSPAITPLVIAGQMALTLYVLHLLLLAALRPDAGFAFPQGVAISLFVIAVCIGGAILWRQRFAVGPLEWALRGRWLERA